jgi:hypothetical protein
LASWAGIKTYIDTALGTKADQSALSAEIAARAAADALLIPLSQKDAANGVAVLDSGQKIALARLPQGANALLVLDGSGLVPTTALPPLAINDVSVVANQAAMLALTAQRGDMAIRMDNGRTYVLSTDSPSTLADWKEVLAAGQVVSVNGQTGVVNLAVADISGLTAALTGKENTGVAAGLVAAHESDTTNVHGIADTSVLVVTSDGRLSDARTPTAHAASHGVAGSDPVTIAQSQVTNLTTDLGALDGRLDSLETYATPTYVLVRNATGATLTKGTIVYTSGANGDHVQVTKASSASEATSARTLGFTVADIANGADGYVIVEGYLTGLDTSAAAAGTLIYLSATPGAWTTTKPVAPNHYVGVGVITRSNVNVGSIFVKVQNGYELDEIHDVLLVSEANGDLLKYDSVSGLWKNSPQSSLTVAQSQVTGLTTDLAGKIPATEKGAANGVATLDAGSQIPAAQIPAVAITDYLGTVANEAAMLALTGQKGDWAIRSDEGKVYVITGANPAIIAGWTALAYPASAVVSVNGETGVVVLDASDVGAATTAQGALADTAVQPGDLGTAAAADVGDFATAAQGALADSATQPGDLGTAAAADVGDFDAAGTGAAQAALVKGLPLGLTGATSATRYVGATASVAPVSGTFAQGDFITTLDGKVFICTTAGTPGTWTQVGGGGSGYATVQDEGNALTARSIIDFVGPGVTATDTGSKTQVAIRTTRSRPAAGGQMIHPIHSAVTTAWTTTGQLRFGLIYLYVETYSAIVTKPNVVGAGSTIRAAIYNTSGFNATSKIAATEISYSPSGTSNVVSNFGGGNWTPPAEGFYWIGCAIQAGTAQLQAIDLVYPDQLSFANSFNTAEAMALQDFGWSTGALPANCGFTSGAPSTNVTLMPAVGIRKA